ncbi:MAG: hypothetical protein GY821_05915, partial [Gammaproteobacteria bacterium]|nr:hypothetical protein [Gammaproteobacteria bacterium]
NDKFISPIIEEDEKPIYYIAVTKSWIKQFIICLAMHCRGSIRGIQQRKHLDIVQYVQFQCYESTRMIDYIEF